MKKVVTMMMACVMVLTSVVYMPTQVYVHAEEQETVYTVQDLQQELEKVNALDKTIYTQSSYDQLVLAISYAQDIYDQYSTSAEAVKSAMLSLLAAQEKLVKATVPSGTIKVKTLKVTQTAIKLSWNVVEGAVGYLIYRGKSTKGKFTKVADVTTNTYTNTKLGKNSNYYYYVKAYSKEWETIHEGKASNTAGIKMKTTVSPEDIKLVATRKKLKRGTFTMLMVRIKSSCKGKESAIKKISMKSSKSKIVSVKKTYGVGLVKGKRKGKAEMIVTVTLKNGLKKVLKTTIKVK